MVVVFVMGIISFVLFSLMWWILVGIAGKMYGHFCFGGNEVISGSPIMLRFGSVITIEIPFISPIHTNQDGKSNTDASYIESIRCVPIVRLI